MKKSCTAALAVFLGLLIAFAAELITANEEPPISPKFPLPAALYAATLPIPGQPVWASGQDYKAQYPQEYAFFQAAFDQSNGSNLDAERDAAFSMVVQKVKALQKAGAKITLGGMLSLLIYEGGARLAHYNTLCSENDYDKSSNCGDHPEARYSYQLGLGAVHTSNFHPCKDRTWTGLQRTKFAQIAGQAGFSPTATQIASVTAELHAFCPASTQPQAVDYYILRAHDLGIPKDGKGNASTLAGKFPFFASRISLAFFFSNLDAQPSQLTSDEKAISIWGRTAYYSRSDVQAAILARWKQFRASYAGGSQPVPASQDPVFSPDGTKLAFLQFTPVMKTGFYDISAQRLCIADLSRKDKFCLPENFTVNSKEWQLANAGRASFSADNRTITFALTAPDYSCSSFFMSNLDGTEFRRLSDCGRPDVSFFSPDGSYMGLLDRNGLPLIKTTDAQGHQITSISPMIKVTDNQGGTLASFPKDVQEQPERAITFSPDSQTILFASYHSITQKAHLDTFDLKTGSTAKLAEFGPVSPYERGELCPSYSKDGRRIVFVAPTGPSRAVQLEDAVPSATFALGQYQIISMDVAAGQRKQLTADDSYKSCPVFIPSGTQIVFGSSGKSESTINKIDADGKNRMVITRLSAAAYRRLDFSISGDGKRIAFVDYSSINLPNVFIVNIDGTTRMRLMDLIPKP
jgi:Tol biopolymer transport system component